MAVQDYKINYKSDFVLTINGDAGWAVPFCIKFWTGMPSQAYFVGFDGVKYVNCRVGDTPTQLLVMFDDHHLPIGPLRMQIAYHTTIEEFPGSVFDEVTNARDVIVTIDGTDYQVMLDFTGEDAPELEFNLPAYANEAERIQNELQRQQNEADRIAAELQREQATAAAVQGAENVNAQLNGTTLTVTNRNGVSTSVNTKGEQGEQGPVGPQGPQGEQGETGISIVSFTPKSETSTTLIYTVTFSDDTTQDISVPKGPQGDTGLTGNGISSTTLNSDYTLTVNYTDGTSYTTPSIRGAQGVQGVSVIGFTQTGETETNTVYNLVFSDGRTQSVAIPKGAKGDKGDTGNTGAQGSQGPKGDTVTATDYTLYNAQGGSSEGAMSQDATTKAISAQTGYYTCGTAAGTAAKVVTVESGNLYKRTLGGHFKVKMTNKNTAASGVTLQIGSETSAALLYNGEAISASNSWEEGEVISVYFDGSNYQATNAKVGSGKAADMKYDNSQSWFAANNVQRAIDEISDELYGETDAIDIKNRLSQENGRIYANTNRWQVSSDCQGGYMNVSDLHGRTIRIVSNPTYNTAYAFVTAKTTTDNDPISYAGSIAGVTILTPNATVDLVVPDNANFLYFYMKSGDTVRTPSSILLLSGGKVSRLNELTSALENISIVYDKINEDEAIGGYRINKNTGSLEAGNVYYSMKVYNGIDTTKEYYASVFCPNASGDYCGIAYYGSSGYIGYENPKSSEYITKYPLTIPSGTTTIKIWGASLSEHIPYLYTKIPTETFLEYVENNIDNPNYLYPRIERGMISISQGIPYYSNSNYMNNLRTGRYIKTNGGVTISSSLSCNAYIFKYSDTFVYWGYDTVSLAANTPYSYYGNGYIKVVLLELNGEDAVLKLIGNGIHEMYNVRPSSGFQGILVPVEVHSPTSCDSITTSVQDSKTMLCDWGVLALPLTYSNNGVPTRLIMYCHGAAVNYAEGTAAFNSQDLEPDYWLAEGYAVMDVEGNPYDNTNEHICIPEALECYVSAYNWIIENYNICKDGVFLGGRSMGGLMVLNLVSSNRIPIIAACPNVPIVIPQWYWNYLTAQRRQFCANHMGFVNQPTWTNDRPMTTSEWNCIIANKEKFKMFSPTFRLMLDVPSDEILFDSSMNVFDSTYLQNIINAFSSCRLKTRIPIKLFEVEDDKAAIPDVNGYLLATMMRNGCNIFEMRTFPSGGHHYDTQNSLLRTTVTTRFGESMSNVPVVYVEMLMWWRRFEQRN